MGDGLSKGQQILLFCPSKVNCSQTCSALLKLLCPKISPIKCNAVTAVKGLSVSVSATKGVGIGDMEGGGTGTRTVEKGKEVCEGEDGRGSVLPYMGNESGQVVPEESASLAVLPPDDITDESSLGREYFDPHRVFISHQRYATQDSNSNNNSSDSNDRGRGKGSAREEDKMVIGNEAYEIDDKSSNNNENNIKNINIKRKEELRNKIENDRLHSISDILHCSPQCDPSLLSFLSCGLAYHHAGLNMQERGAVEMAFKSGGSWT